jgi:hypothetical protein
MGNPVKQPPKHPPRVRQNAATQDPLKSLLFSIAERAERIPRAELDQLPHDFAKNIDHYLYGTPKTPK